METNPKLATTEPSPSYEDEASIEDTKINPPAITSPTVIHCPPQLPIPERYQLEDDFGNWKSIMQRYVKLFPADNRTDTILTCLSPAAYEQMRYSGYSLECSEQELWQAMTKVFKAPVDVVEARDLFRQRVQKEGEDVAAYIRDLRRLAHRGYGHVSAEIRESTIIDRLVDGVWEEKVQDALFLNRPKTIMEAQLVAQKLEALGRARRRRAAAIKEETLFAVKQETKAPSQAVSTVHRVPNPDAGSNYQQPSQTTTPNGECWYCKEFGRRAYACGHNRGRQQGGKKLNNPCIFQLADSSVTQIVLPGLIQGRNAQLLIDSGATCSIRRCKQPRYPSKSPACNTIVRTANGSTLRILGEEETRITIAGVTVTTKMLRSPDIPWDAFLGNDFFFRNRCCIDYDAGVFRISGKEIPLTTEHVATARATTLTPHTNPAGPNRHDEPQQAEAEDVQAPAEEDDSSTDWQMDETWSPQLPPPADDLPVADLTLVRRKLEEHSRALAHNFEQMGRTNLVKHSILTNDGRPAWTPTRRVPVHYQEELMEMIDDMLRNNIIRPSFSPWSSPIVLTKKKDGKLRLCVDYRKLNAMTVKDQFPLPRIDTILDALGGARWFSTLDLRSGYWQVEVEPDDQPKTAFAIPTGLYEFQTMPFGLVNAPATFQRLMNRVLQGLVPRQCLVYLDDVIVHSSTVKDHADNLGDVLQALEDAGLTLNPGKCTFLRRKVKFLGHVVSAEGVQTDPEKVKAIREWTRPTCAVELHSFLSLASYYRRFVPGFAKIAAPLHQMTHKDRPVVWTTESAEAFEQLKNALCTGPILSYPDTSETAGIYILDTDASDYAIGAVLSQKDSEGREMVLSYASKCLSKREKNYCVTRREMLALIVFIKQFRQYLLGRRFLVRTDHQSLRWLQNFRDPEGQTARWQEQLQEYDFECQYRPGKRHANADALSRKRVRNHGDCPSCVEQQAAAIILQSANSPGWAELQANDPDISLIYDRILKQSQRPAGREIQGCSWETRCLWALWSDLIMNDNVLYFQYGPEYTARIVVPRPAIGALLADLHQQLGHAGQFKMDCAARRRFWWPHQKQDVINFCQACERCARNKPPYKTNRAKLQPMVTGYPNEIVGIDMVGPLPETRRNNRYILVMVDYFSKWCEAIAIERTDAICVAKTIFEYWIARFGVPEQLHSDRGSNFESAVIHDLCNLLGSKKSRTTPYHPEGNGLVERTNRTLKAYLKAFVDRQSTRDWDLALPHCLMAYRTTVHSSTKQTPHYLLTGREMRLAIDMTIPQQGRELVAVTDYVTTLREKLRMSHQLAREHLGTAQRYQKEYYDRKAYGSPFQPGDKVWLHVTAIPLGVPRKLHQQWAGPYVILRLQGETTCVIQEWERPTARETVTHFNRLKHYFVANRQLQESEAGSLNTRLPEVGAEVEVPVEGGEAIPIVAEDGSFQGGEQCNENTLVT